MADPYKTPQEEIAALKGHNEGCQIVCEMLRSEVASLKDSAQHLQGLQRALSELADSWHGIADTVRSERTAMAEAIDGCYMSLRKLIYKPIVPLEQSNLPYELTVHLSGWADQIAARYGHPVYLVGSAIDHQDARDVDVVVILPDEEWEARFGTSVDRFAVGQHVPVYARHCVRWSIEMGKLSRYVARNHRVNMDLKVQSESWASLHAGKPRVRLDVSASP